MESPELAAARCERIHRETSKKRQPLPDVIAGLRTARVSNAWLLTEPLGDMDRIIIGRAAGSQWVTGRPRRSGVGVGLE